MNRHFFHIIIIYALCVCYMQFVKSARNCYIWWHSFNVLKSSIQNNFFILSVHSECMYVYNMCRNIIPGAGGAWDDEDRHRRRRAGLYRLFGRSLKVYLFNVHFVTEKNSRKNRKGKSEFKNSYKILKINKHEPPPYINNGKRCVSQGKK